MSEAAEEHSPLAASALLPAAARAVVGMYRPFLQPLQLTHPQYLVLLSLEDGRARTVVEIGQKLALTAGTMTPVLKRLDSLGYISRSRDRIDERRLSVTLTSTGEALIPELLEIQERITRAVGLSAAEQERLQQLVASLLDPTSAQQ